MDSATPLHRSDLPDPRIERTRQLVHRATLTELAESGYGRFTIDSVSERSGVAKSTIYRHWADRSELIADTIDTINQQPQAPSDEGAVTERVLALAHHFANALADPHLGPSVPALIEAAERHPGVAEMFHRYNELRRSTLEEAIAEGVRIGDLPDHVDPPLAAAMIAGTILYRRTMTPDACSPAEVDRLVHAVLHTVP